MDIVKFLRRVSTFRVFEIEAYLYKNGKYSKTRLIIEKVPDAVKNARLRNINNGNVRKGRATSKESKVLQGFNLHITNAPEEKLPTEHVRTLYGVRWQVELVFKNWKSNFHLDDVSGIRKARIECMLYAKLLCLSIDADNCAHCSKTPSLISKIRCEKLSSSVFNQFCNFKALSG